jgi:hypothetical protein
MESCRPAIIVSFGVTAHWSGLAPSVSEGVSAAVQQESIPGRVLWRFGQSIVRTSTIRNISLGPCKRGPGDDDFLLLTIPLAPKCV